MPLGEAMQKWNKTEKTKRKPKPNPLARSLHLIDEERGNVARRTRERKAQLSIESDTEKTIA